MKKSNAAFVTIFVILAFSISLVYGYRFVPYRGVVRIAFHIALIRYTYNDAVRDYGTADFKGIDLNFSKNQFSEEINKSTKILSLPYGELRVPLSLSLNLTLRSRNNMLTLPTGNITFTEEGEYLIVYLHALSGIEPGTYFVKLMYTGYFRLNYANWNSVEFYITLE